MGNCLEARRHAMSLLHTSDRSDHGPLFLLEKIIDIDLIQFGLLDLISIFVVIDLILLGEMDT